MAAGMRSLTCCALWEVSNISQHRTPREALLSICKGLWNPYAKELQKFKTFCMFSGVVEIKGYEAMDKPNKDMEMSYAYLGNIKYGNVNYGPKFAAYIIKNELGEVGCVGEGYNEPGHPKHLVKLWVWRPNNKAIRAWWDKNKPADADNPRD